MSEKVIGIDNGINGAIIIASFAVSGECLKCKAYTFPIEKYRVGKKVRSRYDLKQLYILLKKMVKGVDQIFLEKAESRPGQSAQSTFSTGYGYGVIQSVLTALSCDYEIIPAREWQKELFKEKVVDTKAASAKVATKHCDEEVFLKGKRATKLHDGKTDAFCIALYGYQKSLKS